MLSTKKKCKMRQIHSRIHKHTQTKMHPLSLSHIPHLIFNCRISCSLNSRTGASKLNQHKNHLQTLLRSRFWLLRFGVGPESLHFLTNSQVWQGQEGCVLPTPYMFNHIYRLMTYPKALNTDKSYGHRLAHKLLPGISQEGPFLPVSPTRILQREDERQCHN